MLLKMVKIVTWLEILRIIPCIYFFLDIKKKRYNCYRNIIITHNNNYYMR